jgi:hypothetical protein
MRSGTKPAENHILNKREETKTTKSKSWLRVFTNAKIDVIYRKYEIDKNHHPRNEEKSL